MNADTRLRQVCSGSLVAFSVVVARASAHHVAAANEPPVGRVLGLLAIGGLSVPLLGGGIWFRATDASLDARDTLRVVGWCGLGTVPLAVFAALVVRYQRVHGVGVAEPTTVVLWFAAVGAVGGFLTGVYDARLRRSHRRQRATADRLSGIIETAPVPIVEHDPDGTVRRWNGAAERVFGWSEDEVVGEKLPFRTDEYEDLRDRVQSGERLTNVEIRRERKDGEGRDLLLSAAPIRDADGESLDAVISVLNDVTEQRRRRERLELFRTLLDHSNDSILLIDAETGDLVDANETACRKLGYDLRELLERSIADVETAFATVEEWRRHVETVRDEGSIIVEGEHERADGTTYPVEVDIAHVALDDDGDREYVVEIARDITDRKERERERKRLRKAIEHAGHAIYVTDADGTIEYANPAFEEVTGYAPDEAVGEDPSILQSGEHGEEYYRRLWRTIGDGRTWEETVVDRRKSGELYTAHQTIAPIRDGEGIDGYVAIQNDVTAKRVREQRIDVLNRVLRHNLRTAVTVVDGYAELLAEELDDPELRQHAAEIREQADELDRLGEKARQVTAALDDALPPVTPASANDLLGRVATQCERTHADASVTVETTVEDGTAIAASLEPAVVELVENAIEHSDRAEPSVEITVATDGGDRVSIAVADDGPGIPEIEREAVRDGEGSIHHGSGLGLWLVRWVTSALGGTVDIEPGDPRGNVVTVTVPTVSGEESDRGRKTVVNAPPARRSHRTHAIEYDD